MKLTEGAYENLITQGLQHDMESAVADGLVCKTDAIDGAESPSMLTAHLSRLIHARLADEALSSEERMEFVNELILHLQEDKEEMLTDGKQMLAAVVSSQEDARLRATDSSLARPLSGFRTSSLFTGGQGAVPLIAELLRDIDSADSISIIVSFLKLSGLNLIFDKLKRFCQDPHHRLRIITTTYCGVTEGKAVERLASLPNTEIRISYNTQIERLHAKSYIFERNSGLSTAYIGSSNLSKSAQTDGLEWNIRVTNVENPHIIKAALATFNLYWNSPNFEDFQVGGLDKFYRELDGQRRGSSASEALFSFSVLPHQKQILDRLQAVRANGVFRNLIVAATGTGKTVISAFDYSRFRQDHPRRERLLFVAHRQEILSQALRTYRSVLSDANFGELWVGSQRPSHGLDHLFVSVQTFNSHFADCFASLPADFYSYVVIDEAHHLVADSYRNVLQHFSPSLLIGLTATPERMDGASLLPDFDNQISAEIRLPKALDEGLLTPFQYLCVSDDTDLSADYLFRNNRYDSTLLSEKLCTDQRVQLVVDRLRFYLADETRCRALCFCATRDHAHYMAQRFNSLGLRSASLTSSNEGERVSLCQMLARGEVNYLFVVDMFNEGVDIPSVDTVLFLRPTESLTIFLQQLGRGLRLAPGKQLLTVFDFVAHLNKRYDYSVRFRGLMTRADRNLEEQVRNGFSFLPHGCSIHMEEMAQHYVLENIKSAIFNHRKLVQDLRRYSVCPTLAQFVESNGQDVRLVYRGRGACWSSLRREAGFISYSDDAFTRLFENCISSLVHANSAAYLHFVRDVVAGSAPVDFANEPNNSFAVMFYYSMFGDVLSRVGLASISEAFAVLRSHPVFCDEIMQLTDLLLARAEVVTFPVGQGLPPALEQYGCYSREEVFAIFGRQTPVKTMRGIPSGVINIEDQNTELFFVTLVKSDKEFSPSTMYDDYVVSESRFHWMSQNRDSHSGSGRRFVEQASNGKKFLLFVRESKKDGFGNTSPFFCLGLVNYLSSYGDKPMSIDWQMQHPILPQFLSAV